MLKQQPNCRGAGALSRRSLAVNDPKREWHSGKIDVLQKIY
jgi:hypothetical protein